MITGEPPSHRRGSHDHRARFALGIVIVGDHPGYGGCRATYLNAAPADAVEMAGEILIVSGLLVR
jgi:hypothetical protein